MSQALTGFSFAPMYRQMMYLILESPEYIYESNNKKVHELTNISFRLLDINEHLPESKIRGFRTEFAQKFFKWIMDGETDISKLYDSNPNAKKFQDETYHRNTAYGPRILKQLPIILDELKNDKYSRRAVISILFEDDLSILEDKRTKKTNIEFPCTLDLMFLIRNNKLNMYVNMRSNNMVTTICYDVYNFIHMQKHVYNELIKFYPELKIGYYNHHIISAHIFEDEMEFAKKIITEK